MPRNAARECLCTVPLSEGITPVFERDADQRTWLNARGVELLVDYLGRPSVSVADAYRLRALADESVAADAVLRAKRAEKAAAEAAKAQEARQRVFDRAITQAGPVHPQRALQSAWEAVREAEAGLDQDVRALLTDVNYNIDNAVYQHIQAATFAANEA